MAFTEERVSAPLIEPGGCEWSGIRGRVLIGYLALSLCGTAFLIAFLWPSWWQTSTRQPAPEIAFGIFSYSILLGFLVRALRRRGKSLSRVLGPRPDAAAVRWAVGTGAAVLCIAFAALYIVFVPLSYVAPGFVRWWLLDFPVIVMWTGESATVPVNLAAFLQLVAVAPIVEEVFFRGLLVPSWQMRFGPRWGVVLSALLFAIAHGDILGAFVFGVVTAVVFLKTRSLWIPILIHATNNILVWILAAFELVISGTLEAMTFEDLQSSWWIGGAGFIIGVPALVALLRRMPMQAGESELTLAGATVRRR